MPVPQKMADLATIAANNSPAGSDPIGNSLDDYLRGQAAILRSTNALASASIASASTTDLSTADAESVQITGTTTITSLGNGVPGLVRECRFTGQLVLSSSAAIVLPNNQNITTQAGDVLIFRSLGSGNWVLIGGSRAFGYLPLAGGTLSGSLTITTASAQPQIALNKPNTTVGNIFYGQTGGQNRWAVALGDASDEGYRLYRFNLAGTFVDNPMAISQATGQMTLSVRPVWGGFTPWDSGNFNPANYAALSGANFTGTVSVPLLTTFVGSVGSQQVLNGWGWSNGIARLRQVIEANASYSLYSYDAAGSVIGNPLNVTAGGAGTFSSSVSAPTVSQTSDRRLKKSIRTAKPRDLRHIRLTRYKWRANGRPGLSPIAQEVEDGGASEYVHTAEDGIKSVDKAGLALERVAWLEMQLKKAGIL